jgi:hypothetical protein
MRYAQGKFNGYPMGTVVYYGPGPLEASKAVASVIPEKDQPAKAIKRWTGIDLMHNDRIQRKIREFFAEHGVRTTLLSEGTLGPDWSVHDGSAS